MCRSLLYRFRSPFTQFSRSIDRAVPLGVTTFLLCFLGWAASGQAQSSSPTPNPNPSASATISPAEVQHYARAGLMIENARRQLADKIGLERIKGVSCNQIGKQSNIDPMIVDACQNFNNFVQTNELDQARFNLIYRQHQTDPQLARRILTEMTRFCIETGDNLAPSFCQDTVRPEMLRRCTSNPEASPADLCNQLRQTPTP